MFGAWRGIGYCHRGVSGFGRGGRALGWQDGACWIDWWRIFDVGFRMELIEK